MTLTTIGCGGRAPTDVTTKAGCRHGRSEGMCFHCLPVEEQEASRAMWQRLTYDSYFDEALAVAEEEVAKGNLIRTSPRGEDGVGLVMPYSLFRAVIDVLHDARRQHGKT